MLMLASIDSSVPKMPYSSLPTRSEKKWTANMNAPAATLAIIIQLLWRKNVCLASLACLSAVGGVARVLIKAFRKI